MSIGVKSNNVNVSIAVESSVGTIPSTGWKKLLVNDVKTGVDVPKVDSVPLGSGRMHVKGSPVGVTSKPTLDMDLNYHNFRAVLPLVYFMTPTAPYGTLTGGEAFYPTAVTSTGYTVAANGNLTAGALIIARGFAVAGNNGVKVVGSSSTGTEIKTSGLTAETTSGLSDGSRGATVEVAGIQAAASDLAFTSATVLTSGGGAGPHIDFTTLGLKEGQWIGVADPDTASCFFGTSPSGCGRIAVGGIAAGSLTFDETTVTFVTDAGAGKTIRLWFGPFIHDVFDTDPAWSFRSWCLELTWPNLYAPNPGYEYLVGNGGNTIEVVLTAKSKGTIKLGLLGTDNAGQTNSQHAGASVAHGAQASTLFNTSSDVSKMSTTDSGTPAITYWKSLSFKINNNLTTLDVVALFSALDTNYGDADHTYEGVGIWDSDKVSSAIRNNDTVTQYTLINNADGGFVIDVPSETFSGGERDAKRNEEVDVNVVGTAFKDATFGYQSSVSMFPHLPSTF